MRTILVLICIIPFLARCSTPASRSENGHSHQDSIFLFTNFLDYDEASKTFGDVDEPSVYDYWNESKADAMRYFNLAVKMKSVPASQRMIFASYLVEEGTDKPVKEILSALKSARDTAEVYYIMDSYGISFKDFNVGEEVVKKYCPDIEYK